MAVSWIQILATPLIIGYLVQHLVEPPKSLDLIDMPENIKKWYDSGDMIKVGKFNMFAKQLSYTGSQENPATIRDRINQKVLVL